jgi:hypothetical protein
MAITPNSDLAPAPSSSPIDPAAAGAVSAAALCPACGEPRTDPSARFCEVCRYDFVAGTQGPPPVVEAPSASESAPAAEATPPTVEAGTAAAPEKQWEAVVSVDPSLDTDPDPNVPVPTDTPELVFHLDLAETLIGRRDDRRDIHPAIPLHDPGVSHRHAKLLRQAGGVVAVLDLASTNGTSVNGAEVAPGTPQSLQEGDAITMGRWTRIVLRART